MRRDSPPRFFWQGLLIVLPSILLAAFGLYSLRQDSILAEHEVRLNAESLARRWNTEVLPQLLTPKPSNFEKTTALADADLRGDAFLDGELHEFPSLLISRNERLLFPKPSDHWPKPQSTLNLPKDMQVLFFNAETDAFAGRWTEAMTTLTQIASAPETPPQAVALAMYRRALALRQSGATVPARTAFLQLMNSTLAFTGESGIPLISLASLQILGLQPSLAQAESAIDHAAFASLREPSPLTHSILLKLRESLVETSAYPSEPLVRRVNRWTEVWQRHELLRGLTEPVLTWLKEIPAEPALKWITNSLPTPLLLSARINGDMRCAVWPVNDLRKRLIQEQKDRGWPVDCLLVLNIAGQKVLGENQSGSPLASMNQGTAGSGWAGSIFLANPAEFHARQQARSRRFGIVIGLGLITVVIGFINARRAYLRQLALAEMRTNFVSSVSHELRAPIAAVRLLAEELADMAPKDQGKATEYQSLILRECRRLSGLIENVLDFSRNEQGRKEYQFESTDLAALARSTCELMRIHAEERKITITTQFENDPDCEIEADGPALQQVLVNLLDNAIKHSAPHSEIFVKLNREQNGVRLQVKDQGEGIPCEELPKIFERFYRCGSELTRRTPGVGLGLAIAKYITEAHGGTITAQSVVGQGSTFTVFLPNSSN